LEKPCHCGYDLTWMPLLAIMRRCNQQLIALKTPRAVDWQEGGGTV